jgi:galactokinase
MIREIQQLYHELFKTEPILVRSPGRINLIGDHTDYNQGFVLPAAIDKQIVFSIGLNNTNIVNLNSLDFRQSFSFDLNHFKRTDSYSWANYIMGVVQQLQQKGLEVRGFDCVFGGNIPIGSGMSSSAALECGVTFGLCKLLGLGLTKLEIAKIGQAAEGDFVGLKCGLMDQYANMFGQANRLIQMDCRAESHLSIEVDFSGYSLWLLNSNVKHELSGTQYNVRRTECEQGVALVQNQFPQVNSLRDFDQQMLRLIKNPVIHQRCKFVLEENQRVLEGSKDLQSGEFVSFGQRMYQSHDGLSSKYQVSCEELDVLVKLAAVEPAVLGARMMGGGFGGCTINLIKKGFAQEVVGRIASLYRQQTGREATVIPVKIAEGTSLIKPDKVKP